MDFFEIAAAAFARPGISRESTIAAAIAATSKELTENRVRLSCHALFEPDLTAGLCVVSCSVLGASRVLEAVETRFRKPVPSFTPLQIRNIGSLLLWELRAPETYSAKRKLRELGDQICHTTFDSPCLSHAEAALVVARPDVLESTAEILQNLLARSVVICEGGAPASPQIRDTESSNRVLAALAEVARLDNVMRCDSGATDVLADIVPVCFPDDRHRRVTVAKLAAAFHAGRRALGDEGATIESIDVINARDMVLAATSQKPAHDPEAAIYEEEETFFDRVMRAFSGDGPTEVPMAILQSKVRRSRRAGSRSVPVLLAGLARRKRLQVVEKPRLGRGRGGRATHLVILPPMPALPHPPPMLALPAPSSWESAA